MAPVEASSRGEIVPNEPPANMDDDFGRPMSPLHMPPGQIDGLEAIQADNLARGRRPSLQRLHSNSSSIMHLNMPSAPSAAELALSALQYLPYPLLVLGSLKTLVLANEAMGRLLGIEDDDDAASDGLSGVDKLKGQTLSQIGIGLSWHTSC